VFRGSRINTISGNPAMTALSYRRPRFVTNVITTALLVVMAAFAVAFGFLLYDAFTLTDTSLGLTMSFTAYVYITIEATFVVLMLYGGYYVFRSAIRRRTIEVEVFEED
jgi:uncharacterized membrane protein YqhA